MIECRESGGSLDGWEERDRSGKPEFEMEPEPNDC